jgi:hypothetical protein
MMVGNLWDQVPSFHSQLPRLLGIFLSNLARSKVPKDHFPPTRPPPKDVQRALHALVGLGKLGPFLQTNPSLLSKIGDAGPGLVAWMQWYFDDAVKPKDADPRRVRPISDVLGALLYALGSHDALRPQIIGVPGMTEMAAAFWMHEDVPRTMIELPVGTLALGVFLKFADRKVLDRVVKAVDGRPEDFANTAVTRLKNEMKNNTKSPKLAERLVIYMDFINSCCRVPTHKLRHAFLAAGSIHTICRALHFTSNRITPLKDRGYIDCCVSGFGYLHNCLQSTDGPPPLASVNCCTLRLRF